MDQDKEDLTRILASYAKWKWYSEIDNKDQAKFGLSDTHDLLMDEIEKAFINRESSHDTLKLLLLTECVYNLPTKEACQVREKYLEKLKALGL